MPQDAMFQLEEEEEDFFLEEIFGFMKSAYHLPNVVLVLKVTANSGENPCYILRSSYD